MRVGLVLGGGGIMGGAWLTGGLHALASETGWNPGEADHIVGTSAGSMIGALAASGIPPWFMVAHSAGEVFDGLHDARGELASDADRSAGAIFRPHRGLPWLGPGSLPLALTTLTHPSTHSPGAALAGWLPRGRISTEPLKETVRRMVPSGWSPHPNLWVMACDYRTGRRIAFGREDAPPAELADAVAASCAIPGFYHPVEIAGRPYVDGGVCSASNLDVLKRAALDLVICLNPTSSLDGVPAGGLAARTAAVVRGASGRRLGHEAKRLRAAGIEVLLLQPTAEDLALMGGNPMRRRGRHAVVELAARTVAEQLRRPEHRQALERLPEGDPHSLRRPSGPPSGWPRFEELAKERWSARGEGAYGEAGVSA
jgi:NTE family protein